MDLLRMVSKYDNFEDYFGSRWNCYLSDIIATIPIPLKFAKDQFESGIAVRLLNEFAADPYPYLDEATRKKWTPCIRPSIFSKADDNTGTRSGVPSILFLRPEDVFLLW
jgi:hypothetical protein